MNAPPDLMDVRHDFPLLGRQTDGHRLVYLDSAATSQKPTAVLASLDDFYRHHNANIHRGVYPLALEADALFEGARTQVAAFTDWPPSGTVFTRNATEAVNLVAYAWARSSLRPGDAVLISEMEHHSNIVPWQQATAAVGASLRYLPVGDDGTLSLDDLDMELARGDIRLVALTHVSNVLGTINPVADIVSRAHTAGALVLIDGAQAVPQLPVDLAEIDADFYVWSGHKTFGPTGVGVLQARVEILEMLPPFLTGGDMIATVGAQHSTWKPVPWKFEAGTSPIAQAVGLGAAVNYLTGLKMTAVRAHEQALTACAAARLCEIAGVSVFGPSGERAGIVSFTVDGIHSHDLAEILGRRGVCVRAGHHCAQPLMRRLRVASTTRASFAPYNVAADVDALLDGVLAAKRLFGV